MHANDRNTGAMLAVALQEQFDAIDAAYARGEFGSSRRDERISAAFFRSLQDHYLPSAEVATAPPAARMPPTRVQRIRHYRVMLITGAETMLVKRGGQALEIGLCSVRVPEELQDRLAASLSEVLQFERVRIRLCCRDSTGLLRGVVEKVDHAAVLDGKTVNAALIAAGLGHVEVRCRKCEIGESVPETTVRARLELFLAAIEEQAERRVAYLLQ